MKKADLKWEGKRALLRPPSPKGLGRTTEGLWEGKRARAVREFKQDPGRITRGEAIKFYCPTCVEDVADCPDRKCPLYPYRLGVKDPGISGYPRGEAIRKFCLHCCGLNGSEGVSRRKAAENVKRCTAGKCLFFRYRLGREVVIRD